MQAVLEADDAQLEEGILKRLAVLPVHKRFKRGKRVEIPALGFSESFSELLTFFSQAEILNRDLDISIPEKDASLIPNPHRCKDAERLIQTLIKLDSEEKIENKRMHHGYRAQLKEKGAIQIGRVDLVEKLMPHTGGHLTLLSRRKISGKHAAALETDAGKTPLAGSTTKLGAILERHLPRMPRLHKALTEDIKNAFGIE